MKRLCLLLLTVLNFAVINTVYANSNPPVNDLPVINCRDTVVDIPAGQCSVMIVLNTPEVDNCNSCTISNDHPSTIFSAGTTLVTWTVTDALGNQASCVSRVIAHKTSPPMLNSCPGNISMNNTPGQCGAVVNFSPPVFSDDCSTQFPDTVIFNFTGHTEDFVVPGSVTSIRIAATGGDGGNGGSGAFMSGDFTVTPGETLHILVGGRGEDDYVNWNPGGGGGTFIWRSFAGDPLLVAGGAGGSGGNASTGPDGNAGENGGNFGGGGGGTNGNGGGSMHVIDGGGGGGAGWKSNGDEYTCHNGGKSPANGGAGGSGCAAHHGGFGGGGAGGGVGDFSAGGGGGYSGGGCADFETQGPAGGGGSFNAGTNQLNFVGVGTGNGQVKIYFTRVFPAVQQVSGLPAGAVYPIGTTVNQWSATDISGNVVNCSNTVTVTDNEAPVMQCTPDIVVNTDPGQCTAIVNYVSPTAIDNCDQAPAMPGYTILGTFNNHDYYLSAASANWNTAKTQAMAAGGTLVCINTAAENNFLSSVIPTGQHLWLGGFQNFNSPTYSEPAGGWEWVDGSSFYSYTNWFPNGNPDNFQSTEHVMEWLENYWNDATETNSKNYLVEIPRLTGTSLASGPASGSVFPIGTTAVTWSATDIHGNTAHCTFHVTVNGSPSTPVAIGGPTNICAYINTGEQIVYSVDTVRFATGYQWTVPPTVSIVSGQGTNSITVTIGSGFAANTNKVIRVKALSPCANSAEKLLYLLAQSPSTPAAITASSTDICSAIGNATPIIFKIPKTVAATSYIWTAQNGTTTITHPNGTGVNDTTISVIFSSGFTTSTITVQSVNDCGTGGVRSYTVTRSNPTTPSLINGPTNVCANIGGTGVPAVYTVAGAPGNTYNWTIPAGATGLTGQGTNSISFTYPPGFTSGSVSLTVTNGCGTSPARTLAVSKLNPATPGVIDVIQTQFCPARAYSYTLSTMPANASTVQWTVPAAALGFTGQGTTSITVYYPDGPVTGSVTATAINNCGTSTVRSTQVKLPACPPPAFSKNTEINSTNIAKQQLTVLPADYNTITVVPNPSTSSFKLAVNSVLKQKANVIVSDASGRRISVMSIAPGEYVNFGNDLKAGVYLLQIEQGNVRITERIVKL